MSYCWVWETLDLIYVKWLESHLKEIKTIKCYRLNCVPQNVYTEASVSQVIIVFRDKVFKFLIKLK